MAQIPGAQQAVDQLTKVANDTHDKGANWWLVVIAIFATAACVIVISRMWIIGEGAIKKEGETLSGYRTTVDTLNRMENTLNRIHDFLLRGGRK